MIACGDSPSGPAAVGEVAIQLPAPALLLGDSVQLVAVVTDAKGRQIRGRTVAWSSQNPAVVRVDARGMAYGDDVGTAGLTATVDGVAGTISVSVNPTPVARIDVGAPAVTLAAGMTTQLAANLRDASGRDVGRYYDVVWSSGDERVVTVSSAGVVTAVGQGNATVTGRVGSVLAGVQVTVQGFQIGGSGGVVTSADGRVRLQIPSGALTGPTVISIRPAVGVPDDAVVADGSLYTFEPSGLQFAAPVTVTITYGANPGIAPGAERYLALHRWTNGVWVPVSTMTADTLQNTVSGQLTGFSTYAPVVSDLMASLETFSGTLTRVLGDPVVQDAVSLILQLAAFAQASDHPLFNALVEPAIEAARATICNVYRDALGQASTQPIDGYSAFYTHSKRLVLWEGVTQTFPDNGNCAPTVPFETVMQGLVARFADFTIARLSSGNLETDFRKLIEEARQVLNLRADAGYLGLQETDVKLVQDAQEPLMERLRTAAYNACRTQRDHVFLGDLRDAMQDVPAEGYDESDLENDLQLCGTDFLWTFRDANGEQTASGRLGGGDEPGSGTITDAAPGLATGTLRLEQTLLAFRCVGGTFEQDELKILFGGKEVHTIPWHSGGNLLMQPTEVSFESMIEAAGIDATKSGTYPIQITRRSTGCGRYVSTTEPATLATLNVTYPVPFVYTQNFQGEIGTEWTRRLTAAAPSGARYLGPFGQELVTLNLTNLPEHQEVTIEFDFHVMGSWNGNALSNGPDRVFFQLDALELLTTTFANNDGDLQAYPGAYPGASHPRGTGGSINTLGYPPDQSEDFGDATYRIVFTRPHSAPNLAFRILSSVTGGGERWGIDNVRVTAR